jgi:hypothetical protein
VPRALAGRGRNRLLSVGHRFPAACAGAGARAARSEADHDCRRRRPDRKRNRTASGRTVRKDASIAGLSGSSITLPLLAASAEIGARPDCDDAVLDAIAQTVAGGSAALLQIMDSSKLGWRAPSDACLDEIARRWPNRVQIVVDACQMRLSRRRLKTYLDRGYMVLVTGSKFFGGPAFSGALLLPAAVAGAIERGRRIAAGLADYASRSDWPQAFAWRSKFESQPNIGQWLRWEAALTEMTAYYQVPVAFRRLALREIGATIASLIALSPSLGPIPSEATTLDAHDEEFIYPTIFPFTVRRDGELLSATDCRLLHRALMRDCGDLVAGSAADRAVAAERCLVGQPVRIERRGEAATAVLRLCVGARLVTDNWSSDQGVAQENLQREADRVAAVIGKIELLTSRSIWPELTELAYGN